MTYGELLALVCTAKHIGTVEAKREALGYIYASKTVGSITIDQRAKLVEMLMSI